jgi:hypothetical protein
VEKYGRARDHRYQYNTTHGLACWITEAKNTNSEYVMLIAFPLLQWLLERAAMLHCMYIACLDECYAVYTGKQLATLRVTVVPSHSGSRHYDRSTRR